MHQRRRTMILGLVLILMVSLFSAKPSQAIPVNHLRFDGLAAYSGFDFFLYREVQERDRKTYEQTSQKRRDDLFPDSGGWRRRLKEGEIIPFPEKQFSGTISFVAVRRKDGVRQTIPLGTFPVLSLNPPNANTIVHIFRVRNDAGRFALRDQGNFTVLRPAFICSFGFTGTERYPGYQFFVGDGDQLRDCSGQRVFLTYLKGFHQIPTFTLFAVPRHVVKMTATMTPIQELNVAQKKARGIREVRIPELRNLITANMPRAYDTELYPVWDGPMTGGTEQYQRMVSVSLDKSVRISHGRLSLVPSRTLLPPASLELPPPVPPQAQFPAEDFLKGWQRTESIHLLDEEDKSINLRHSGTP